MGRQGSPLGARWNSTSFSGHTTAKGKENGKEEVRREAQRRCRLVHQLGLCMRGQKRRKSGTLESSVRGVKTVHKSQAHTLLQPLEKNSFKFTNTENLAYPEKSVLFSHKHMWVTFDNWVDRISTLTRVLTFSTDMTA